MANSVLMRPNEVGKKVPKVKPQAQRPLVSLNGEWTFQFGDEQPGTIQVPGPWESQRHDLHGRAGTAVYERRFTVPREFEGQRVLLSFGAVDYFAEVWVNDIAVGTHEGGYTPFAFDITRTLRGYGDVENTVTIRVTDATVQQDAVLPNGEPLSFAEIPHGKQSWYTSIGGIWQGVALEGRAYHSVTRAAFHPDVDRGTVDVTIVLENLTADPFPDEEENQENANGGWEAGWQVRIEFDVPHGAADVATVMLPVSANSERDESGRIVLRTTLAIPQARLWHPDEPNLYTAAVTLEQEGEVLDALTQRFGMRKIETKEGRIWLNNRPFFLIGALDQDFYPKTIYTPPSEDYLRDQFRKAKEMGLNTMRCHIKIPPPAYLDLCDEMGLLVWYEIPNGARLSPAFRERAKATFTEMWERDGSHPCIGIATIINESWGIDLNNPEQRRWLAQMFRWTKELVGKQWLIVDNSACIPNFHVVSDLEDYHVYFNIPDQADDFAEWVTAFAERQVGTYTGYGDAETKANEPLLISEFGNWGLPRVDNIMEAEGGEPYWFRTGDGATRPHGVEHRFEWQGLRRVFPDYNALAEASQEQEWIALKFEIEEMRRHTAVAGYVITEFTDINWECNGLLDMGRNPKVFHSRMKDLQQQDILVPRLAPRASFWEEDTAALTIEFSCFSGRAVNGGTLAWEVEGIPGLHGVEPVRLGGRVEREPTYGSYPIGQIWITAPTVVAPSKHMIRVTLQDVDGREIARTTQNIVFAPVALRQVGRGQTVWLHDPFGSVIGLSSVLTNLGCRVVGTPEPGALGLVTRWDPTVSAFLREGGRAILVANGTKSITIASGLGVRLLERNTNGWWGDWCTSKIWFAPEQFPSLPDTLRFDFEFQPVVPERVLTGPLLENTDAGLFVGWLHNPAALVARLPIGRGDLIVTTFDLLPNLGSDPIATLMLHDLMALPPAIRPE